MSRISEDCLAGCDVLCGLFVVDGRVAEESRTLKFLESKIVGRAGG